MKKPNKCQQIHWIFLKTAACSNLILVIRLIFIQFKLTKRNEKQTQYKKKQQQIVHMFCTLH